MSQLPLRTRHRRIGNTRAAERACPGRARRVLACSALAALVATLCAPSAARADDVVSPGIPLEGDPTSLVNVDAFYDGLAPYGEWIWNDDFGWVWSPYGMEVGWRPYTHGRWVWTDAGWMWVADEPWGWAPFHYGRWFHRDEYGWLWVPGPEWAPAWVAWREGAGYVGWAPLPPRATFDARVGLQWHGDVGVHETQAWSFVAEGHLLEPSLSVRLEQEPRNVTLLEQTRPIPNDVVVLDQRVINRGVAVERIQASVGHPIPPLRVASSAEHATRLITDRVEVYRPRIAPLPPRPSRQPLPPDNGSRPAPERIEQSRASDRAAVVSYAERERKTLAERHAADEARSADQVRRRAAQAEHARERSEQRAQTERERRATEAFYARSHQARDGVRTRAAPEQQQRHPQNARQR